MLQYNTVIQYVSDSTYYQHPTMLQKNVSMCIYVQLHLLQPLHLQKNILNSLPKMPSGRRVGADVLNVIVRLHVVPIVHITKDLVVIRSANAKEHFSPPARSGLFPTCQVRVVRFYVNSRSFSSSSSSSSPDLNYDDHSRVFAAGPQPRPATPSVRCRTSTTTIHAQCSLPDLNSYAESYAR